MESFKILFKPFNNMDEMLIALNIIHILKESSNSMKTNIINSYLNKNFEEKQISFFISKTKIYQNLYPNNFFKDQNLLQEFIYKKTGSQVLMEFEYEEDNCVLCNQRLQFFTFVECYY
ncbi:unnamed protein product [Brachionus calyciflorus]|uniref:Uncharacterized protein n=1 Tax=Brachionus calyciflorus TaxID=104777 RepID=A0A814KX08_9BILA|nr:unnamed protein product [Brachionus calyciflorus]